jgi:predicted permease
VGREHEFAVRASLGASPWRLARAALTESMVLALAAMPVALLFAYAGLQAMLSIVPKDTIPDEAVVTMNIPVLLISLAIAAGTILIFGSAPAWRSASPHPATALQGNSRTSASRAQRRLLGGFVITEIALSFALLALAGLMVRSLLTVENVPISADPDHTLVFSLPLTSDRYPTPESQVLFFRQFLDRAETVPGVRSVSIDAGMPFLYWDGVKVQVPGQPVDKLWRPLHLVDPAYLQAAGRTLVAGHFIDAREVDAKSHDAVISQSFVRQYFAGGSVLGRTVHLSGLAQVEQTAAAAVAAAGHTANSAAADDSFTIVGVVKDATASLVMGHLNPPEVFLPYSVAPQRVDAALVETALPPAELIQSFRRLIAGIDKDQPIADAMSLRQLLDMYGYAGPRFALALFGAFAVAGLLLACIGVYSVLSFVTSQRTQEIGIRIALGARRPHVMWIVLRQACLWSAAGVVIGLPLALAAGHFAQAELFHTSPYDPLTLISASAILPLLAIFGTCLPARRAATINPVVALRAE